jgi:hypothetical protein
MVNYWDVKYDHLKHNLSIDSVELNEMPDYHTFLFRIKGI